MSMHTKTEKEEKEIRVRKIENGTVIDHISPGQALNVLKILGIISELPENAITIAMNVPSKKLGKKDIVKIENREISEEELGKISLISPEATINIVRNNMVVIKKKVKIPEIIEEALKCANINCITNYEKVKTKFYTERKSPLKLRCHYCERIMKREDVLKIFEQGK